MGTYFLAATFASILGGRLVQRIGPRRQLIGCLSLTIVAQSLIATIGDSFGIVVALLAVCGVVNAGNQTAVNLALTRARLPRLGLAIALKQSGMPSAAMISGATVRSSPSPLGGGPRSCSAWYSPPPGSPWCFATSNQAAWRSCDQPARVVEPGPVLVACRRRVPVVLGWRPDVMARCQRCRCRLGRRHGRLVIERGGRVLGSLDCSGVSATTT